MADSGTTGWPRAVVERARGWVPGPETVGAVAVPDAGVTRVHYGNRGSVLHPAGWRPASGADVARLRDAFAARGEPVQWRVYEEDAPQLRDALREAGFVPGAARTVLVAETSALPADAGPVRAAYGRDDLARVAELAAGAGEQRTPFDAFLADGSVARPNARVLVLPEGHRIAAASWARKPPGTGVAVLDGLTAPRDELVAAVARWAGEGRRGGVAHHVLAEATGPLCAFLERHGFRTATTVTPHRWSPPGGPAAVERPVRQLLDDPEHDALWDAWCDRFAFRPDTQAFPAIAEPPDSATWRLPDAADRADRATRDAVQAAVARALRATARPDEPLYWLDWQHPGYRFDPRRVGGPDQPPWPGTAWPDGDYHLYLTADLRLGTFAHPWERTLCAFGPDLRSHLDPPLTHLLGPPLRRAGRLS